MRLLCLNLWGGRKDKLLFDYLKQQAKSVDIFCFQEVFDSQSGPTGHHGAHPHLYSELQRLLANFESVYGPTYTGWIDKEKVNFEVSEGQAIFVKKDYAVLGKGSVYIYGDEKTIITDDFKNEPKNLLYTKLAIAGQELLVVNPHGKWYPGDKLDTPERLEESQTIINFLKSFIGPKILCGDFNLMPDTESIAIIEKSGLRNLITEFKITNTRNEISWRRYRNKQRFADYIFTSPEVRAKNLEVPYNLVADHLPLILDFEL